MRVFPDLTVDGEFQELGSRGFSGTLNDRQFNYLRSLGRTGSLPDMLASGDETPSLFDHQILNQSGSDVITDVSAMRVRIDGGSWQTLSAASLAVSQTAAGELTVSGFSGSETSIEFHYEQEQPGEPYSAASSVNNLFVAATSGSTPVLTEIPGMTLTPTQASNPVVAS